jgi:uncharacterized SAM-binding protein YcdF (DUF218 family)
MDCMQMFSALLAVVTVGALSKSEGRRRAGKVAAVALLLFCWTPVSMLVVRAVQGRYTPERPVTEHAGAIVVLAGSVHAPFPPLPEPLVGAETYERSRYGAWLSREWRLLPVVLSGGSPDGRASSYASAMRTVVLAHGVPESQIVLEENSRTTAENAQFTAALLKPRGIHHVVLVTDAVHMRRARKAFEKAGMIVTPAPCSFRHVYDLEWKDALPSWRAIEWNEKALHEVIGLAWYWLRDQA